MEQTSDLASANVHSVFGVVHLLRMAGEISQFPVNVEAEIHQHRPPAIVVRLDPSTPAEDLVELARHLGVLRPDYRWQIRLDDDEPDILGERWPAMGGNG